jgi:SAM-dependent methyltransferase
MDDLYANWARVYDLFYPGRSEEVDFWVRLAEPCGRRILDLMCGTAEVSLGLARHGYRVLGVDRSPAMLAVGAQRLAAAADYPARNLSLAQGDACALPACDSAFDLALVGGLGSFNHLDAGKTAVALCELARVLRPGGILGLELTNPYLLTEISPTRTFGPLRPTPPGVSVGRTVTKEYDRSTGDYHIHQETVYEVEGERREFAESFALHVREPDEVQALLTEAGFVGMRVYGDHSMAPYTLWSFALLVVAHKAARSTSLAPHGNLPP